MKISDPALKLLLQKAGETKPDQLDILRASDSPIAEVVTLVLEAAIHSGASDIHIEPRQDCVQVRYRIDGLLREASKLPRNLLLALIARIKVLAVIQLDEHSIPQDGRFQMTVDEKLYALRVSTLPIADGEKMVIRIRDESTQARSLEELGYWGPTLRMVHEAMVQPYGIILFAGPAGAGLSTSLYTVINLLNTPKTNIATIEDPIEYRLPGINQAQVNQRFGMTFPTGLQAVLRQDPNIVMVSDLRDSETVNLMVQAALGGRLLLAGLHANSSSIALSRLRDIGIEPFLTASAIRTIIGQRLVRRLCDTCKQHYKPTREQMAQLFAVCGLRTKAQLLMLHKLEQQAAKEGVGKDVKGLAIEGTTVVRLFRANPDGCETCLHSGYKGRVGVFEALPMSAVIQKLVIGGAMSQIIQTSAVEEGMVTMLADGLIKSLRGQTTVEEVLSATQL